MHNLSKQINTNILSQYIYQGIIERISSLLYLQNILIYSSLVMPNGIPYLNWHLILVLACDQLGAKPLS